jgi:hypothetical protein
MMVGSIHLQIAFAGLTTSVGEQWRHVESVLRPHIRLEG